MPDSNVVAVPLERYEELVQTEMRVNAVVERISHSDFFGVEDVLWLLNTELSVELAQEMYDRRRRERAEWEKKYQNAE